MFSLTPQSERLSMFGIDYKLALEAVADFKSGVTHFKAGRQGTALIHVSYGTGKVGKIIAQVRNETAIEDGGDPAPRLAAVFTQADNTQVKVFTAAMDSDDFGLNKIEEAIKENMAHSASGQEPHKGVILNAVLGIVIKKLLERFLG